MIPSPFLISSNPILSCISYNIGGGLRRRRRANCNCITHGATSASVSIPKPSRGARRAANSHIAVVGAGMLRATRRYVSMRPVEGVAWHGAACRWYSRESEVFFSHSIRPLRPPVRSLPLSLSLSLFPWFPHVRSPADDYQINKGEYQIKLRL